MLPGAVAALDWVGVPEDGQTKRKSLDQIMQQYPLGPNEGIRLQKLSNNGRSATMLMQVRAREPMHRHADSDTTMFVLKGQGSIQIGDRAAAVKTGDVIHIPRETSHAYSNQGPGISVVVIVYSPAPGPNDRVVDDGAQ